MELEFLKKIVKEASNIVTENFEVYQKDDKGDLVTSIDYAVEKYLIDKIKERYPSFDIVSEETNSKKEVTDNCFIIDPIDGTVNFAHDIPFWGIQIACKKEGNVVACVIYLPKLNEFYYADETGAYLNEKKLSVKPVPLKNMMCILDNKHVEAVLPSVNKLTETTRIFNSLCLSLAFISSNKVNSVVFDKDANPWDAMPGLFLCEKAGAFIEVKDDYTIVSSSKEFIDKLDL